MANKEEHFQLGSGSRVAIIEMESEPRYCRHKLCTCVCALRSVDVLLDYTYVDKNNATRFRRRAWGVLIILMKSSGNSDDHLRFVIGSTAPK